MMSDDQLIIGMCSSDSELAQAAKQMFDARHPPTVTPPGHYIQEKLDELGMSRADLAAHIGVTEQIMHELIQGNTPLSPDIARELGLAFGIPARFWNNAERQFREAQR